MPGAGSPFLPPVPDGGTFPARLRLAMKAPSLTRARLAAELAVDTSAVARWVKGRAPSAHNLAALTRYLAERRPGFSMLDWELDEPAFLRRLAPPRRPSVLLEGARASFILEEALRLTRRYEPWYEGMWVVTRPCVEMPGRFVRDSLQIEANPGELLSARYRMSGASLEGRLWPGQAQLFLQAADALSGGLLFGIFNAVLHQRAVTLDGLLLTVGPGGAGTPFAAPCVLEREAADVRAPRSLGREEVPDIVRRRLRAGLSQQGADGGALLVMSFAESLSGGRRPLPA